jgi:hypothetical protein
MISGLSRLQGRSIVHQRFIGKILGYTDRGFLSQTGECTPGIRKLWLQLVRYAILVSGDTSTNAFSKHVRLTQSNSMMTIGIYLAATGLILSLVVRYWPGQPPPQWISVWIDRLWLLLGVTLLIGIILAFFNTTTTILPRGGYLHTWSTPREIRYVLGGICVPLAMLALIGAIQIVRSEAGVFSRRREVAKAWATAGRLRRIGLSLAVALGAVVVSFIYGGPLTYSSSEGYSDLVPSMISAVAAIVFFAALASAWSAARVPPEKL